MARLFRGAPPPRAGQFRHRIAFDKRLDADDGYGNTQSDFVEQFRVFARVQARFGGEAVTAARLVGQQPVTITVRRSSQTSLIAPDWRARDVNTGVAYAIKSIVDPDDSRAWLEILTQTGVAA
jgi:SPP1 family predicted phage head-tail adaptor